jgi:myxalamid-type polyketide synthase MxaE and MxaD
MVESGARSLTLMGRNGLPDRAQWDALPAESRVADQVEQVLAIEALGATVQVVAADVADRVAMHALFARFGAELPPLRGIVHAAAALSNWSVAAMPQDALHAMLRPKVTGTWLLHELTRDLDLDFFVLFSSTTALWGARDLAHYAAANEFLDAFAHYRRSQGLPALSINWGTWDEMRVASDEERRMVASFGLEPMPSDRALQTMGDLLGRADTAQIAVASVDWEALKGAYESRRARPLLSLVASRRQPLRSRPSATERPELLQRLEGARDDDRYDIVVGYLRDEVAHTLGIQSADSIDDGQGLFEMGMDSLMSVELKSRIGAAVGATLPSTLTFNYPTIDALADFLTREVLAAEPAAPAEPDAIGPVQDSSAPLGAPHDDDLSEDDLAAMLAARLATP